jgi:hypothetical protein
MFAENFWVNHKPKILQSKTYVILSTDECQENIGFPLHLPLVQEKLAMR